MHRPNDDPYARLPSFSSYYRVILRARPERADTVRCRS